ncbi:MULTISPECIES: NAD-dependent succinate-semialdehyde dehydrogenase [unclassified Pseudoalteromonas]|uniref:NAD-dependent succinate-semialdehyde dehydrogenase n=1 Tax=unclassified Pseudoalteromonas TaxID=194690 RepID=UPI000C07965B|nr:MULTISPECIES: NAD-dependent succinate-semialdehyde dehydrogenase [unclassified Pseudoalteromonas]MDP2636967.1 NAD-dependent succinate-semialdehyde dehydrogenase [Pseudoalteromonas sp. 1_MG-2023]PHN88703.1 succinate-semialdehyde dehydrogenase (NADP(+)) [Pseudoalteromonas sp. 3D05]
MSHLVFTDSFINGEFYPTDSHFDVTDPATDKAIASVSDVDQAGVQQAIDAAHGAFIKLKSTNPSSRSEVLMRWYELVIEHKQTLAELMTKEQGKPLKESLGEVEYGAGFIKWFAEQAKRSYGDVIPPTDNQHRLTSFKQPIGVVAGITPWNFPIAMVTRKVAPAYAAGCSFVLKPSEHTPLCALALAYLADQAGFEKGAFNVLVSENAKMVGELLTESEVVRKFTFTGSTGVGKQLLSQCASTIKRTSMELGGNAPFIIFDNADLDEAVTGLMGAKFRNAGQTCVAANRIFVQRNVLDEVVKKLNEKVTSLKVASGFVDDCDIGPLIYAKAKQKVQDLLSDAKHKGATQINDVKELGGNFQAPVILTGVTPEMDIYHQEVFGPVVSIIAFDEEAEVLALANDVPYGLAAYFYSQNIKQVYRVSEALEYGMVGINEGLISNPVAPFGGVKQSGLGREGGHQGLDEYLEEKYVCMKV